MRTTTTLALVLALAAGCGKSDKKGEGGASAKTAAGKAATGGDPAAMITGSAPTLPPELAAIKFGQPKAEALKAVGADSGYVSSKTNKDINYNLDFSNDDKLQKASMTAQVELEPLLTKAWGPPIKTEKEMFWFSPATGVRAYLPDYGKGKVVAFDAYEPVEKVLGEKGIGFAFAGDKPLIGMTPDELKAALGDKLCNFDDDGAKLKKDIEDAKKDSISSLRSNNFHLTLRICNKVPRTVDTYNTLGDQARFGYDGKLNSIYISFNTGKSGELLKQLAAQLDTLYGGKPAEVDSDYGKDRWYFDPAAKRQIRVSLSENSVGVEYMNLLPIAELIGGDKPGLSIEGPHLPVGTFEQIKADDPTHYYQTGELAQLYYPPTEFNVWGTEVDLEQWSGDKKTRGYRVVLHHTKNEAQGDKVFELLKAKFGEPKVDKSRTTDKDKYWTFSKNGRKVEARRVSEQWQLTVTK